VALIAVDDLAENTIIVIPGANGQVGPDEIDRLSSALKSARILLLQLEIPIEMVIAAARMAHGLGVTVILDPAPAQVLPEALYACVDVLTPNQTEAARLAGFYVGDIDSTERAALVFLDWGVRNVIIKMGDQGVYSAQKNQLQHIPAFPVKPVDTVAAGDAFNGALAAAMAKGCSFDEALRWGLAGGALAVTKAGAQTAMPDRAELIKFLEAQSE
jgi:ribokinase